jgi:hypothetical protein
MEDLRERRTKSIAIDYLESTGVHEEYGIHCNGETRKFIYSFTSGLGT